MSSPVRCFNEPISSLLVADRGDWSKSSSFSARLGSDKKIVVSFQIKSSGSGRLCLLKRVI